MGRYFGVKRHDFPLFLLFSWLLCVSQPWKPFIHGWNTNFQGWKAFLQPWKLSLQGWKLNFQGQNLFLKAWNLFLRPWKLFLQGWNLKFQGQKFSLQGRIFVLQARNLAFGSWSLCCWEGIPDGQSSRPFRAFRISMFGLPRNGWKVWSTEGSGMSRGHKGKADVDAHQFPQISSVASVSICVHPR